MLWSVGILLVAALCVDSYAVHDLRERLTHGGQLKIYLPKTTDKLEFIPAAEYADTILYWERGRHSVAKGRVSGTGSDRRWYLDKVTYEDQGTYVQRDYWNKEMSVIKVAVTPKRNYVKCVAGESLYISLEGLDLSDASLLFSTDSVNISLVHDGARVSQDLPDYWDRVKTHSMKIEIKNVNHSDEGSYTLRDRRDRPVSITRMDLTDHHDYSDGNPLMALLLLLGIPAGICCCCRKKIFKKKPNMAATVLQSSPDVVHLPPTGPTGPTGPCPPYNAPGQPGTMYYYDPNTPTGPAVHPPPAAPGQWNGPPPSAGFNPAYPPQNPAYSPQNPAYSPGAPMMPGGQPPQWSGPPQGPYPPAGAAPVGYTPGPVMYNSPPADLAGKTSEDAMKMENMTSTPADPLLAKAPEGEAASSPSAPAPPPSSFDGLHTTDDALKFQIDGGKNSSFL